MTNQLSPDDFDEPIPARKPILPGFYFLPNLADPTAPTAKELAAGLNISHVVTIELPPQAGLTTVAREEDHDAAKHALGEMAAVTGVDIDALAAALNALGNAAPDWGEPTYVMPPPKPWAGNIATQKRRRKL